MKGGFVGFGGQVIEAYTYDDCILIKTCKSFYIVLKFRDEFVRCRITRKRFDQIKLNG
jgi:hypothetical protein